MRDEKKKLRHEAITKAAYKLLAVKGYDGTSMLSISKAAKASNETLYRWYGDKRGLFDAMVRDNAAHIKAILDEAIEVQENPIETLTRVSPILLTMLLGERAILLNRAAAADPTGELGVTISMGGRDVIQPLLESLVMKIESQNQDSVKTLTQCYLGLLIGDLQFKRVIGVNPMLTSTQIEDRSSMALRAFFKLLKEG